MNLNFKKKVAALAAVAAMSAMTAFSAFAVVKGDYDIGMYGYKNGSYVLSSHTDNMIDSVTVDDDGNYVVEFKPATVYGISGYISAISTPDGEEGVLDTTDNTLTFVFAEGDVDVNGKVGTTIDYTVTLATGTHSTSTGAIVIEPAE